MNCRRGSIFTNAENGTFSTSMTTIVPVNSHGSMFTPPATPLCTRMGRRMSSAARTETM